MDPPAAGLRPVSLSPLQDSVASGHQQSARPQTPLAEILPKSVSRSSAVPQARPRSGGCQRPMAAWACWVCNDDPRALKPAAHRGAPDRGSQCRPTCRTPGLERSQQGRSTVVDRYTPDILPARAQTPTAKAAQRRTEERRGLYSPQQGLPFPGCQKGQGTTSSGPSGAGNTLSSTSEERHEQNFKRRQQEASYKKALHDITLGHKWLRIILDGMEAVLESLRPRVRNLEHTDPSPTVLDVHRMAMRVRADLLGGFQELQEDCSKDEPLLHVALDGVAKARQTKSWAAAFLPGIPGFGDSVDRSTVKPITPDQARAIETLLRFVSCLDALPIWPKAFEAAVDFMQGGPSATHDGSELKTVVSSTQQVMRELQGVQCDAHDAFEHLREALVEREDRTLAMREASEHTPSEKSAYGSQSLLRDPSVASLGNPVSNQDSRAADEIVRVQTTESLRRTTIFSRRTITNLAASGISGEASSRRPTLSLTDPQSAGLWGVTLDQLSEFHDEIIEDLDHYCEDHRMLSTCGDCMHICSMDEECAWDHHDVPCVHKSTLLESESDETQTLLPNMYLTVEREVKPRTKDVGCSYALMQNPAGIQCNIFVTHAWCEPFRELVSTLQMALAPHDVIWLCSLALNQHDTTQTTIDAQNWDRSPFFVALKQSKKQVVALDEKLNVPDRAWCTFEMMAASLWSVNVSLWFYHIESLDELMDKIESLDMSKGAATRPSDLEKMKEVIDFCGGFEEMNERVRDVVYDRLSFHKQMIEKGGYIPTVVRTVQNRLDLEEKAHEKDKADLEVCRKRLFDLEHELQDQKRKQAEVSQKLNQKRKDQENKRRKRSKERKEEIPDEQVQQEQKEDEAEEKFIAQLTNQESKYQVQLEMLEDVRAAVERELREALESEMSRKEQELDRQIEMAQKERRKMIMLSEEKQQAEARHKELAQKAKELDATKQRLAEVEEELSWVRGEAAVTQYALQRANNSNNNSLIHVHRGSTPGSATSSV